MENIIDIIQKHSLTVRCLPYITVYHWTYREGDEKSIDNPSYDGNGNIRKVKKSIVTNAIGRKLLREEREVEKGGWWYVKETQNTDSTVRFDRKYDKFFAPTIEEALQLYLDSLIN